jgi:hypothetical protein
VRLSLDDRNRLSLGNDVVEFHQNRFDFPPAVAATGISIFIASPNAAALPSPIGPPTSTAIAQMRPYTSVTSLISGMPLPAFVDGMPSERLFVVAADCLR